MPATWTDIDWLDGETITETKMDAMAQNIVYVKERVVPSGAILIWSGSIANIPDTFYLCDGNNGTPNLTDRFVIGAGNTYAVNDSGGSATHSHTVSSHSHSIAGETLTVDQIPSHTHTQNAHSHQANASDSGYHFYSAKSGGSQINPWASSGNGYTKMDSSTTGEQTAVNQNTGGGQSHNHGGVTGSSTSDTNSVSNLPPYYALAFIMKS